MPTGSQDRIGTRIRFARVTGITHYKIFQNLCCLGACPAGNSQALASAKTNGRWYRYQRPLRLNLEVLGLEGHSFLLPASGSPAVLSDRRFA